MKISLELTVDQLEALIDAQALKIAKARVDARSSEMSVDPSWEAFNKRILTELYSAKNQINS